jgi:hypothetical protein
MLAPATFNIFIQRGIVYGPLTITCYDDLPPLPTPDAPAITPEGASGAAAWSYKVVAVKANGSFSAASAEGTTDVGNADLDDTNFNRLTWVAVPSADLPIFYRIYRTAHGTTPSTDGLIGVATGTTFDDTGLPGDGTTPPVDGGPGVIVDLTGFTAHAHARRSADAHEILEDLAPVITNPSGGEITIGKFTVAETLLFKNVTNGVWSVVLENVAGDWLPPIVAGIYAVTTSVTRKGP